MEKKIAFRATNILTLVLSEKKILNETKKPVSAVSKINLQMSQYKLDRHF